MRLRPTSEIPAEGRAVMRRSVFGVIFALGALTAAAFLISLFRAMAPPDEPNTDDASQRDTGLKAEPDTFNLSTGGATAPQRIVARLKNTSHQPISILSVKSSCGCTVPYPLPAQPVGPGKTIELPIAVSPLEFGTRSITVTIATSSKSTPTVPLQITTRGRSVQAPYLAVAPSQVRMVGAQPDDMVEYEFTIQTIENRDAGPWIQRIDTRNSSVKCVIAGPPNDETYLGDIVRRTYRIRVQGKLAGRKPTIAEMEIITASPATRPVKPIWVNVVYEPAVRAIPSLFTVRAETADAVLQREILLMTEKTKDWTCDLASVDLPPGISIVKLSEEEDPRVRRFRVSIDHRFIEALGQSTDNRISLRFSTGIDAQPVVEVPVVLAR